MMIELILFIFGNIDFSNIQDTFTGYTIQEKITSDKILKQEEDEMNNFLNILTK